MFRSVCLSLLGLALCCQLSFAQATMGTISGTVSDASGGVLPGAKVVILTEDTGISRTLQTDAAGRYSAPSLGLGKYRVTTSQAGFETVVRSGIVLTVGREAVVNVQLTVGAVTQAVEVTGEAPLVESTTSSLGYLVDDRTIRELPLNGRSYDQLAVLQPGVTAYGGGSGSGGLSGGKRFTVDGSKGYSNAFMLDGTDINDATNGTPGGVAGQNLGVDGIREFKILTNNYNAEYGRGTGGVVTAVTKSGTNAIHGSLFEFLRNSDLDARNFFDKASPPPFKRNQYGGSLGGPIKHDKTFYFGTFEGLRQGLSNTQIATVPTAIAKQGVLPSGTIQVSPLIKPFLAFYPDPNGRDFGDGSGEFDFTPKVVTNEDYFMTRVDHQISDKVNIFGRYSYDSDSVTIPGATGLPSNVATATGRRQYATIQANSLISPALLNTFHIAYNRSTQESDSEPTIPLPASLSFIPGQPIGAIQVGGSLAAAQTRSLTSFGTSNSLPRGSVYNLFEVGSDLTYVKGKHSFKVGANVKRLRDNTTQNTSLRGIYTFSSLANLLAATPSNFEAIQVGQNAYRGMRQMLLAFYGQDDFKITQRFTLNVGLRWEAATDPTEVNGKVSLLPSHLAPSFVVTNTFTSLSKKNLEPRVGFAWQLDQSGKTAVRAGFGVYHDQILPNSYALQVAKIPPFYTILDTPNAPFPNGYQFLSQLSKPRADDVAPHLKAPTKIQYNVNLQQQVMKDMVVELAYVGSESSHLWRSYQINTAPPSFVNGQVFYPAGLSPVNPNFTASDTIVTDANANYNAAQITFRRKSTSGFQYQAFYVFSKTVDLASAYTSVDSRREPQVTMNPLNPGLDRGQASWNAEHNFVFYASYPIPFHFQQKPVQFAIGGWTVDGIGTVQSGQPFTVLLGFNNSRNLDADAPDRPSLVPGRSISPVRGGPDQYYDPTAFFVPTAGTFGNLGRNTVMGPGLENFDASLHKDFPIRERLNVSFRAEFFNILNRANFGLPSNVAFTSSGGRSGSAGRITSTVNSSRQIQFALKITF